jgi:gamma-glutamyltranspeptidase/glutathione hydrolase
MIAAAHPRATEVGAAVLNRGGTAADAALATQAMLNLVEPQSSGFGGGAFILYWDASARQLTTIDGRETAPAAALPARFLDAEGKKHGFWRSAVGGQSVGVPGTPSAFDLMHRLYGQLPRGELLQPTIALAEAGFEVSPRLAKSVTSAKHLDRFDATRAYFFPQGQPLEQGAVLKNPAFADMLRRFAERGAEGFYQGPVAAAIVDAVNASSFVKRNITLADLAGYRAKVRPAICVPYRAYEVCGMGPPTSGGLTVGQILGMLSRFDLKAMGWGEALVHHVAEAAKLAYADRALYMADSDFVKMPTKGLVDPGYLQARSQLIDPARAGPRAKAGTPPGASELAWAPSGLNSLPGTSHFVVWDKYGNAASITTTIESGFGSRVMAAGMLLNNELTDFDRQPEVDGRAVANRVQGGKRPRSSMSPTVVLRDGEPHLLVGSPGGSRIIGYVAKTLVGILDFGMAPQDAINSGHFIHRNGKTLELEKGSAAAELRAGLEAKGHAIKIRGLTSGLHAILKQDGRFVGGADPRREGKVIGSQ